MKALPLQSVSPCLVSSFPYHSKWYFVCIDTYEVPPSKWHFVCINSEKCFRTVWKELAREFPAVFDHCTEQTLWNTARDTELRRPLTQAEEIRRKKGIPNEQIAQDRLWNKRPDGFAIKMPTKTRAGVVCLLEFKRMSDVTSQYIVRTKRVAETQYASLRSGLVMTMHRQGWNRSAVAQRGGAQEKLDFFQGSPRKC